jgi:hypothetical protein
MSHRNHGKILNAMMIALVLRIPEGAVSHSLKSDFGGLVAISDVQFLFW